MAIENFFSIFVFLSLIDVLPHLKEGVSRPQSHESVLDYHFDVAFNIGLGHHFWHDP